MARHLLLFGVALVLSLVGLSATPTVAEAQSGWCWWCTCCLPRPGGGDCVYCDLIDGSEEPPPIATWDDCTQLSCDVCGLGEFCGGFAMAPNGGLVADADSEILLVDGVVGITGKCSKFRLADLLAIQDEWVKRRSISATEPQ